MPRWWLLGRTSSSALKALCTAAGLWMPATEAMASIIDSGVLPSLVDLSLGQANCPFGLYFVQPS
jgi:hypothetical protein